MLARVEDQYLQRSDICSGKGCKNLKHFFFLDYQTRLKSEQCDFLNNNINMKPIIDISQSALDSPDYRVQIMRTEQSIWNLESTVKSLHKSTKNGVEAAAEYSAKNSLFANELEQLAAEESDEPVVLTTLQKFAGCIKEIERSRQIMLSQLRDVFTEPLDNLVKKDIAGVKVLISSLIHVLLY